MLTEERIEEGFAGEDVAPEMAVAAVVGEEGRRKVLRWCRLQINGGVLLFVEFGAP